MTTPYPYVGPCAFCGHPDSRHRIVDAIRERIEAGEDGDDVQADYGLTPGRIHEITGEIADRQRSLM